MHTYIQTFLYIVIYGNQVIQFLKERNIFFS